MDQPREITEEQLLVEAMEKRMKEAGEMFDKDLEEMVNVLVNKSKNTLKMSSLIPGRAKLGTKPLEGTLEILSFDYPYVKNDNDKKNTLFENVGKLEIFNDGKDGKPYLEYADKIDLGVVLQYIMLYPSSQFYYKDDSSTTEGNKEPNYEPLLDMLGIDEFWGTARQTLERPDTRIHEMEEFMDIDLAIEKFSGVLLETLGEMIDKRGTEAKITPEFTGKLLLRLLFYRHIMMIKYIFLVASNVAFDDPEKNNSMDMEYSQLSTVYRRYRMLWNFKKGENLQTSFHLNFARHLIIEFFKLYYEIQAVQQKSSSYQIKEEIRRQLVYDYDRLDLTSSNWLFVQNSFKDAFNSTTDWLKNWWEGTTEEEITKKTRNSP